MKWTTIRLTEQTLQMIKKIKSKLYLKEGKEYSNNEVMKLALENFKVVNNGRR